MGLVPKIRECFSNINEQWHIKKDKDQAAMVGIPMDSDGASSDSAASLFGRETFLFGRLELSSIQGEG